MKFSTVINIPKAPFELQPCEQMLFTGSCFAERIGTRFFEEKFRAMVNPFGVMYNPASVLHTVEHVERPVDTLAMTLGTNRVYVEKSSGEIVDNCQKRPQSLFYERELSIDECVEFLSRAVEKALSRNANTKIIVTVSPIRYAKYGYHESQLAKAVLLLAADRLTSLFPKIAYYFPAYEIVNDELRDYRFYEADMLHPNAQAVEYIWERLQPALLSEKARQFIQEWKPIKEALAHKPFNPEAEQYKTFMAATRNMAEALQKKYPEMELHLPEQ